MRGSIKSSPARTSVFRPTTMMAPNSRIMIPPMTGTGMELKNAPSLLTHESTMAQMAAHVMTPGLNARVRATAPVTSE